MLLLITFQRMQLVHVLRPMVNLLLALILSCHHYPRYQFRHRETGRWQRYFESLLLSWVPHCNEYWPLHGPHQLYFHAPLLTEFLTSLHHWCLLLFCYTKQCMTTGGFPQWKGIPRNLLQTEAEDLLSIQWEYYLAIRLMPRSCPEYKLL